MVTKLFDNTGWKIVEDLSFNGRTVLGFQYAPNNKYGIMLFNLEKQPNSELSHLPYTTWGNVVWGVNEIDTLNELLDLINLYTEDLFSDNIWWEKNETD